MSGNPARWLTAIATAGLLAAGLSTAATAPAHASAPVTQTGPAEVGNLLVYANTDFEGTLGNWVGDGNAKLTDDTTHSFLHNDSLLDTAAAGGTSSFSISGTPNAIKINLPTGGQEFRVGAYFKAPVVSGQTVTVQFSLGCWGSSGYLKDVQGTKHALLNTTNWQYSEDDITVPAGCTYVQGSPKVTLGGLAAGAAVNMDEVIFAPYRAALIIGAKGQDRADGGTGYDAADWMNTNQKIGPLQSDKEFYGGNNTALPGSWTDQTNICYEIEQKVIAAGGSSADWPACVINLGDLEAENAIQHYFTGLPPAQMVIMVFEGEPERNPAFTSGAQFVSQFDTESQNIRKAAVTSAGNAMPNVFVAMDSSTYEYGAGPNDSAGTKCGYIPPTTSTDFYLADHYDEGANGKSLPNENSTIASDPDTTNGQKWLNWLSCVQSINKPLGLAEYGLDCHSDPNQPVVSQEMGADNPYLAAIPSATEPTIMWEYWYSDNGGNPGCVYTNTTTMAQWQAIETQNGGG